MPANVEVNHHDHGTSLDVENFIFDEFFSF